jgi:hypothetical protein
MQRSFDEIKRLLLNFALDLNGFFGQINLHRDVGNVEQRLPYRICALLEPLQYGASIVSTTTESCD